VLNFIDGEQGKTATIILEGNKKDTFDFTLSEAISGISFTYK